MKLAAVVFDWAGTMIDFGSLAPVVAMQRVFAAEGVPIEVDEVRADMGRAKRDHIRAVLAMPRVSAAWTAAKGAAPNEIDGGRIHDTLLPFMLHASAERSALIPGARDVVEMLRTNRVPIGSTTGYTREMMAPILAAAATQGYTPDSVICAGETKAGRPSPLMLWQTMVNLGVYPADRVIKVDDAPVGIAEGKAAGCYTIGVAASGNALGLDLDAYQALAAEERTQKLDQARSSLRVAGADLVIDSVADLAHTLRTADWL